MTGNSSEMGKRILASILTIVILSVTSCAPIDIDEKEAALFDEKDKEEEKLVTEEVVEEKEQDVKAELPEEELGEEKLVPEEELGEEEVVPEEEREVEIDEPEKETLILEDWTVSDELTVEDVAITLNGNLVIKAEASLTLRNVDLVVNCSYDGEYGILVEPEGSLFIYYSKIVSPNPLQRWNIGEVVFRPTGVTEEESPRFSFLVNRASSFVMVYSELQGCGYGHPYGDHTKRSTGLWLDNVDSVTIKGNTFSRNHSSLNIDNMSNLFVQNNIFSDNDACAMYLGAVSNITISDNTFSSNMWGIFASHLEVRRATISNNTFSVFDEAAVGLAYGCEDNVIADNTISTGSVQAWAGIFIGNMNQPANNNSITRNTISGCKHGVAIYYSSNNRIENNSIAESCCGIALGYASKNIIINNIISHVGSYASARAGENGVDLYHSRDNIVANNSIASARTYGIVLHCSSTSNTLQSNDIQSCWNGIGVYQSSNNNSIINNSISLSVLNGIILNNSEDNIIYGNNFVDNYETAYDNSENQWYWRGGGNYWNNYSGQDEDNDGVGDSPQLINLNSSDNFPMNEPLPITPLTVPEQEAIPSHLDVFTGQPIIGEAVFPREPISGQEVWQNSTLTLFTPQLEVAGGGKLTIDNVTLIIPKGSLGILVHPGGSLEIYNSTIMPAEDGGGFLFQVYEDGILVMKDSELHGCGFMQHSVDWGGLQILTTTATIENNLITDSHYGIAVHVPRLENTSIYIRNNIISNCYQAFTWPRSADGDIEGHIENNTILNCIK
jgi:parallel beta-helix repeat protein